MRLTCLSSQAARGSIQQDELTAEQRQALMGEEDQQKITTYEEAFKQIKEATGVSDTQVGCWGFPGGMSALGLCNTGGCDAV